MARSPNIGLVRRPVAKAVAAPANARVRLSKLCGGRYVRGGPFGGSGAPRAGGRPSMPSAQKGSGDAGGGQGVRINVKTLNLELREVLKQQGGAVRTL